MPVGVAHADFLTPSEAYAVSARSRRRDCSTTTDVRTSAAPSACSTASVSPKTRNARNTVTTGSTVARIDALLGPTRRRPAKKKPIAANVETNAMQTSHSQPSAVTLAVSSWPSTDDPIVSVTAAPLHTRADSKYGLIRIAALSLTRM